MWLDIMESIVDFVVGAGDILLSRETKSAKSCFDKWTDKKKKQKNV